ncbi:alpha/beta hydrolase family protein [Neorhizobium alkalisoli]|uniref:alpha/beta hydrolase family protein n=1 Tax=Neorhizobium alkalisoli TaxID=528178 RepID=UPI000CF9F454|nr:alpha/beta fold hydrolase [Neorhizobium alkalisoli]
MRLTFAFIALLYASVPAFAGNPAGVQNVSIASPARGAALDVTVFYPSKGDGEPIVIGQNRVFEGMSASKNATIEKGRFPLVLLSHGSGSRVEGMAWIATKLAEAGFIVAGPNHPGTTSGDSTPAATPKIWERAQDLSTIITALTNDPRWQPSIDKDRIGVLGFSLGGSTAMELAGARADLDAYIRYCEDYAMMMDCRWFQGGRGFANNEPVTVEKLDLRTIDKARFEQSNRDPRIVSAVVVDPGLAAAFKPESLKGIDIPLTIINLGSTGKIPVAVRADKLVKQIPNAAYAQVDNSDHFSFLPVCKQGAAEFLDSIGDPDPICEEDGLRLRTDIHKELIGLIMQTFERTLKSGH